MPEATGASACTASVLTGPLLVPLDGSPLSEAALPYAAGLTRALGSSIVLIGVDDGEPQHTWGEPSTATTSAELSGLEAVERYLETIAERLRYEGATVSVQTAAGGPVEAILSHAETLAAGMLIMATRGRGGVRRWLLGSTADAVMRGSTRPILLVHPRGEGAAGAITLHRLMVPLDGSALAEEALRVATELAGAAGAAVMLVRAVAHAVSLVAGSDPLLLHTLAEAHKVDEAGTYLQAIESRVAGRVPAESTLLVGTPRVDLVDFALQEHIDLVVMTTHGRGGIRRAVLGSMANRFVRCGAPVLLVPQAVSDDPGSARQC